MFANPARCEDLTLLVHDIHDKDRIHYCNAVRTHNNSTQKLDSVYSLVAWHHAPTNHCPRWYVMSIIAITTTAARHVRSLLGKRRRHPKGAEETVLIP
jgi:hypothetical protein